MLATDITARKLLAWGGEDAYREGLEMARGGLVLSAEWDPRTQTVAGDVITAAARSLHSSFKLLPDGYIQSFCPCAQNQRYGVICKHVMALGCMIMLRNTDPAREERYRSEQRASRLAVLEPSVRRAPDGVPARLQCGWGRDFAAAFASGRIAVHVAFTLPDGRRLAPSQLPRDLPLALSDADDNLLSVLEDIAGGVLGDVVDASPADFLNILELRPHGKAHAVLRVDLDEPRKCFVVRPDSDLPADCAGLARTYLVHDNVGFVFADTRPFRLDKVLSGPYQFVYSAPVDISRAEMPDFLETQIPMLERQIEVAMSPSRDLFEFTPAQPQLQAALNGSRASLRIELFARYGETTVVCGGDPGAVVSIPDPDDLLLYRVRNRPAEAAAVAQITAMGFIPGDDPDSPALFLVGQRAVEDFLAGGLPFLRRAGWKFSLGGKVDRILEENPHVVPVVTLDDASGGAFDVTMSFEVRGRTIPHADIQRALNKGESMLDFEGGSFFIDTDAIESMRKVFEDCRSSAGARPGSFRVGGVYAPFVQSALRELDGVEWDDDHAVVWRTNAARRNRDRNARLEPVPLGELENTLRPYQKDGVYWMRFLEKSALCGLLADEMGLGKTLQTLTWISLARCDAETRDRPAIVICPTSLVENWNREAEKFVPHLRRLVISGPNRAERFREIPGAQLVITSYALLPRDFQEAYSSVAFSLAVLDEAQHIKNRQTRSAQFVKRLDAHRKLALTGTPVENSVSDVWSIFDFLMPDYLGDYESFKASTEDPIAEGGKAAVEAQRKLKQKLHPFILRRVKKEVAKDLPDKIVRTQFCTMTEQQQRVYAAILAQAKGKIGDMVRQKGFAKSKFEILALLTKLRQCSCHLGLLKEVREGKIAVDPEEASGKVDAFLELLDEARGEGHRMLVFSQFTSMLAVLRKELDERGVTYCYLDGATKNRLDICAKFNTDRSIPVFLISLHAGGTGLTLTGADMVVHFDPWWNPAVEDQATDRAHRIGQKKTVFVVKMIAQGSVEERVLALQKKKQLVIDATVGGDDAATLEKLTYDDVRALLG